MRNFVLTLSLLITPAMVVSSSAQPYISGAPPGGVGTYQGSPSAYPSGIGTNQNSPSDDPRWRNDNWRSTSPDDWRANNWREDRSGEYGTWRRNNWREDRSADDWRYNYREEKEKAEIKNSRPTVEQNSQESSDNDCNMSRNRPNNYSNAPCRR